MRGVEKVGGAMSRIPSKKTQAGIVEALSAEWQVTITDAEKTVRLFFTEAVAR